MLINTTTKVLHFVSRTANWLIWNLSCMLIFYRWGSQRTSQPCEEIDIVVAGLIDLTLALSKHGVRCLLTSLPAKTAEKSKQCGRIAIGFALLNSLNNFRHQSLIN